MKTTERWKNSRALYEIAALGRTTFIPTAINTKFSILANMFFDILLEPKFFMVRDAQ
jgi:hypothetical protein